MGKNLKFKISETLDYKGISRIFDLFASKYCTKIAGNTEEECNDTLTGCGLNDNCPIGQRCKNNRNAKNGYTCGMYRKEIFISLRNIVKLSSKLCPMYLMY